METLLKKDNLAFYIISKYIDTYYKQISPIKLQKSLYFLFAMWGGKIVAAREKSENDTEADDLYGSFNPYLFDAEFHAWKYGPVERDVYNTYKRGGFDSVVSGIKLQFNSDNPDEIELAQSYIDSLLDRIFITNDFALVDLSHEDKCWKNAGEIMNNDAILKEYADRRN